MKTCSRCNEPEGKVKFGSHNKSSDGLQYYCTECNRKYQRQYYADNIEKEKERGAIKKERGRRLAAIGICEYLSSHCCIDCGEADILKLEFDHIGEKESDVCYMVMQGYGWQRILEEIAKCVIRCANCHRVKTMTSINSYRIKFLNGELELLF